MKDNMYTLLNAMDIQVEDYEISEVSSEEVKRWKKAFRQKRNKEIRKKEYVWRYVVAVAVLLICTLALGPFQQETYAQIKTITYSVKEMLGKETDLSAYETVVGKTIAKDGFIVTVNDVVMDRNEMVVSYTVTAEDLDDTTVNCSLDVKVNGKSVGGGSTGQSWMADDNNMVSVDKVYVDDVDVNKKNYYTLVFYVNEVNPDAEYILLEAGKIGSVKFVASGEQLAGETTTVSVDKFCEFPNGDRIRFTKLSYNRMGPKIFCESENGNLNYEVWLKGTDNLGNEMYFYLTHFEGDGESWFILADDIEHDFHAEANSITLQIYAVEMPEQSGEIGNDYQSIGEPFTIQLK